MEPGEYAVFVETDVTTLVARLSESDQEYILVDLVMGLRRDPHAYGDVWMTMGDEVWRVLEIGPARLAFVVVDVRRTVTLVSLTMVAG